MPGGGRGQARGGDQVAADAQVPDLRGTSATGRVKYTADYLGNTASVLLGNGNGTFQARTAYATGGSPTSIVTADLNGDGKSDVVTTDYGGSTASVLLGNGDGTFQARTAYATG
ncbi:MAG: VCBS repeat-containing protein, partial [Actinobacteria bacterium]|nr:VCBS repeat-containing protein [Actinomycetota bacterium]